MGLALVSLPATQFNFVLEHVASYSPHRNMHMRQTRTVQRIRRLRYLHALHVGTDRVLDGAISGPGLFWRYQLCAGPGGITQMRVLAHVSSELEEARLEDRFASEVVARVIEEQTRREHFAPNRSEGEFYLQRWRRGTPATHELSELAVRQGVLDRRFVELLEPWNLRLLRP